MARLSGKTALVTGSAQGIGRAVADRFIQEGARVVFADRDVAGATAAADAHPNARGIGMDIADEPSVVSAFEELAASGWSPDVVVANAGVQLFGEDAPIAELDLDTWKRTIDINLTGTFLTVKHAVRAMMTLGGGSIILTGSPTALNGEGASFAAYSASKAGIHGMTRTTAAAYSAHNIRVNTVVPAYTETNLVTAIAEDPEARSAIIGRIPLGRPGSPADIGGIMVYLASDDAAFATGASFAVDGGMTTL